MSSDRKIHVKNTIEKYITSSFEERLDQLSFGVEIETQCKDASGDDWSIIHNNLDGEDYMDLDTYLDDVNEDVRDYINNNRLSNILQHNVCFYSIKIPLPTISYKFSEKIWYTTSERTYKSYYLKLALDRIKKIENRVDDPEDNDFKLKLLNKVLGINLDSINHIDREVCGYNIEHYYQEGRYESDYYYDIDDIKKNHPHLFKDQLVVDNSDVEIVSDQSVSGQECRTIGGLNYNSLVSSANSIFDAINSSEHYIDTDCSAHLHIKLGDIEHYFGNGNVHNAMMEYIAFNFDRLPKSVQKRLHQGGNRWISLNFHDTKYSWIHFHGQGTIEFRLFGNIDNTDDLLQCVKVATEALAYGYQVRFKDYVRALECSDIRSIL